MSGCGADHLSQGALLLRVAPSEDEHANHLLNSSEQLLARALLRLADFQRGSGRVPLINLDLAHALYSARGRDPGRDLKDWLQADIEVLGA